MTLTWIALLLTALLFAGMLTTYELGRRIGVARFKRDPEGLIKGAGAAEGAVFALLGLLIAFTFSGAASRFEARRFYIDAEANAIGTAYLRIDLLPAEAQAPLRDLFRRYTEIRATVYQGDDLDAMKAKLAEGAELQMAIWKQAASACQLPGVPSQTSMLMLPALNEMIDITATRATATSNHPPPVVYLLLVSLSLIGGLLVGYGTSSNKDRSVLHQGTFALVTSLAIYVIIDLEYPRLGLIRIDAADQALIDVRSGMR